VAGPSCPWSTTRDIRLGPKRDRNRRHWRRIDGTRGRSISLGHRGHWGPHLRPHDGLIERNRPAGRADSGRRRSRFDNRCLGQRDAGASQNDGDGGEQSFAHRPSLQLLMSGPSGSQGSCCGRQRRECTGRTGTLADRVPSLGARPTPALSWQMSSHRVLSTCRRPGCESNLWKVINSPRLRGLTACNETVEIAAKPEGNGISVFARCNASPLPLVDWTLRAL
jgi:hypothetical protein